MSVFQFPARQVVTSYTEVDESTPTRGRGDTQQGAPRLSLVADNGRAVGEADQFVLFILSDQATGPTILEASQIEPKIVGADDEPDVLVGLEMLSFHVGDAEQIDANTCATLRINFGKDESSENRVIDTVFWSIAAGLRLYDESQGRRTGGKEYKSDFRRAFANRPIEIPGGLGRLSIEVVKHVEPPWWRKVLGYGSSQTAKQLISVLGFPAITVQAIELIDELLNRLEDTKPQVLFRSIPMRLALSKWASDKFTHGNPRVRMGCLRPGFCVLARKRDHEAIAALNAVYYPHHDKLAPAEIDEFRLLSGDYDDPFAGMTYAVFKVGMKATKIDPVFDF